MFNVRLDTTQFTKAMRNATAYSIGFIDGVESDRLKFNKVLAEYSKNALEKYIDAKARGDSKSLHHVYEPERVGDPSARLFSFETVVTKYNITFNGKFLPSSGIPSNSTMSFVDKANIMENAISVTITPKKSDVLVFEDNSETVFTTNAIYVAHPGGDAVAGSFGHVVDEFFLNYFTNALLAPMISDLQRADEFTKHFRYGVDGGGRSTGLMAGKSYLNVIGRIE